MYFLLHELDIHLMKYIHIIEMLLFTKYVLPILFDFYKIKKKDNTYIK